jgi:anti-sigma B factor antagonist
MVFVSDRLAIIKIIGRANFTSSIDFKLLINDLFQRGCTCYLLDLSECLLMDSTFLGVLAGFGLKMMIVPPPPADGAPNAGAIELLNPNTRIAELLENLGVIHLFKIRIGTLDLPKEVATHTPAQANPTRDEFSRNCLEAHRILMEISPDNVPKFKEVTQFLADDLKKSKTGA